MRVRLVVFATGFLGFLCVASAGEAMSLQELVRAVITSHPQATARQEDVNATVAKLDVALAQRWPTFSVDRNAATSGATGASTIARVQQPLYEGGKIDAGILRAQAALTESQAALHAVQRELALKTSQAFIETLRAQDRLDITQRNVETFEGLVESITRRVQADINPGNDALLARSRLALALKERVQAQAQLEKAKSSLAEVIGNTHWQLVKPSTELRPLGTLVQWQDQALAISPDLRRYKAQEIMAEAEITQRQGDLVPRVFVRYDYVQGTLTGLLPTKQTILGLEMTTGAGMSVAYEIQAAQFRKRSAESQSEAVRRSIQERIQLLWADLTYSSQQLLPAKEYLQTAQQVAQSYVRLFPLGRKSWLEVQNAQREAYVAEMDWSDMRWNAFLYQTQLDIEAGELAPSALKP